MSGDKYWPTKIGDGWEWLDSEQLGLIEPLQRFSPCIGILEVGDDKLTDLAKKHIGTTSDCKDVWAEVLDVADLNPVSGSPNMNVVVRLAAFTANNIKPLRVERLVDRGTSITAIDPLMREMVDALRCELTWLNSGWKPA